MSDNDQIIYQYMLRYQQEHAGPIPPTLREIAAAVGMPLQSVHNSVRRLVKADLVIVRPYAQRKYLAVAHDRSQADQ